VITVPLPFSGLAQEFREGLFRQQVHAVLVLEVEEKSGVDFSMCVPQLAFILRLYMLYEQTQPAFHFLKSTEVM
jgi:hypothetical protein